MQIIQDLQITGFESWERDSYYRTKLTVLRTLDSVTLSFAAPHMDAATLGLDLTEAKTLSSDIQVLFSETGRLLRWGENKQTSPCRTDDESKLVIEVRTTTQGDPYQEGVSLAIRRFDHSDVAHIELAPEHAFALAKVLGAEG